MAPDDTDSDDRALAGNRHADGPAHRRIAAGSWPRALLPAISEGAPTARLELSPDEWAGVIASAERHQVAGLLYWQLRRRVPEDQPPPDAMARLHGAYMAGAAQALLRERELRAVLSTLSEAGIIPTLFKGAVLARTVYPTAACRPMGDLDLWIDDAQMPRAIEALEASGYAVARRLD